MPSWKYGFKIGAIVAVLLCAPIASSGSFSPKKGSRHLFPSLSFGRSAGEEVGWIFGFNVGYGSFITDAWQWEVQGYFDAGPTQNGFYTGGVLGGASYYLSAGRVFPFAGLRVGGGVVDGMDSDGGMWTRATLTVSPKLGVLIPLSERWGFSAYIEYHGSYVFGKDGYGYNLHLIRIPLGVSILF